MRATAAQAYKVFDLGLLLGKDWTRAVTREMVVSSYDQTKTFEQAQVIIQNLENELAERITPREGYATLKQIKYGMHLEKLNSLPISNWSTKTVAQARYDIGRLVDKEDFAPVVGEDRY